MQAQQEALKNNDDEDVLDLFEYTHASAISDEALQLANEHRCAPYPKVYEVLFEFAAGHNKDLKTSVHELLEGDGRLTRSELELMHRQHLDPFHQLKDMQTQAGQKLGGQISNLNEAIGQYMSNNDSYRSHLEESSSILEHVTEAGELQERISELLDQNQSMHEQTLGLTHCLEQSRQQIDNLKSQLMDAVRNTMLDPLTGLGNRRWMEFNLNEVLLSTQSSGDTSCIALIDLDHFKRINDNFGHLVGDKVLSYFGNLITRAVRKSDVCARYGGEEFCLILRNINIHQTASLMEKIRSQLKNSNFMLSNSKTQIGAVTASFGITEIRPQDNYEELLERVDKLLYQAKKQGRDRVISG